MKTVQQVEKQKQSIKVKNLAILYYLRIICDMQKNVLWKKLINVAMVKNYNISQNKENQNNSDI